MSNNSNILEIGLQSFKELGHEFVAAVLGSGPTGQTSLICGASGEDDLQTYFYLNPMEDTPCAGSDWVVILIMGLLIHAISWGARWFIWEPLANARMRGHKSWTPSECHRLSQTCTSLLFFSTSALFAARILLSKEWLFDRPAWAFRGPLIVANYKFYYLLYASRFFSDLVSIFFEDRKKDAFIAAFIHHLVTLALVLLSAHVGHSRYGGVIMFFFDWADIPLLSAKICKYLSKHPKDSFQFVANRFFELFAVSFFLTRNCYFNYVVWSCWRDLTSDFIDRSCHSLLFALVALQTYWIGLVIQAVIRQHEAGGNVEDIREDEDGSKKKK